MDLISSFGAWIFWLAGYVVPFVFVLAIVVFFHELGHFLMARWCGVRVAAFSIGFGRELAGVNDRHGTRWKVCAIPLGGYVKFFGDRNGASIGGADSMNAGNPSETFLGATVGRRIAIVVAGPLANFLLAILIFATVFMWYGRETSVARVEAVQPNSAAAAAGIEPGDLIVAVDGNTIESFAELVRVVSASAGNKIKILVDRRGSRLLIEAIPELREVKDVLGNVNRVGQLGLRRSSAPQDTKTERFGPIQATWQGVKETWYISNQTLRYISNVVVGREPPDQLGGPIKIAKTSGQIAAFGFIALMQLVAILSVSLGLFNLFPIPALDGGHILFYAIEAARGRPMSAEAQKWGLRIGVAAVLALMIFATINDVLHLVT
jgi:regulator of sigma E protease